MFYAFVCEMCFVCKGMVLNVSINKKKIFQNLQRTYKSNQKIIAIAAGSGLSAKHAAANGVDLILALNSGKYRQMGLSSLAGMMPFSNSNDMVIEFASREIIPRIIDIPVIFGLCATDPTKNIEDFIDRIIENDFSGINNFPTVGLIDGKYREYLEEKGFSYQKEVDAIRIANQKGLFTVAFVFNVEHGLKMAEAGADVICAHLGFTRGGILGVKRYLSLNDASHIAKEIFDELDRHNYNVIKLIYGGPIQTPLDAKYIIDSSGSMGFVGGSSFERIPTEKAISETIAQFKNMGVEQNLFFNHLNTSKQPYEYIQFIKKFVDEHYMEEILFSDFAKLLHISRNHLSYLFKKEMGCTFPSYLLNVRMNRAMEIIQKNVNLTVKDIADHVGFTDQSYFTKKFKEVFGISPYKQIKKAKTSD